MNQLPNDPFMLFSVINTRLRDFYPSLAALCEDMQADEEKIKETLRAAGFTYDAERNQFC